MSKMAEIDIEINENQDRLNGARAWLSGVMQCPYPKHWTRKIKAWKKGWGIVNAHSAGLIKYNE